MKQSRHIRIICIHTLAVAALLLGISRAEADWVLMKDNRYFEGDIIKITETEIQILTEVSGILTAVNLPYKEVQDFEDQADDLFDDSEPLPDAESAEARPYEGYVRVPVSGRVGDLVNTEYLELVIKTINQHRPEVIIFEIESKNGYLPEVIEWVSMQSKFLSRYKVVYYCLNDAIPPIAMLSLAGDEIFVQKGTIWRYAPEYDWLNRKSVTASDFKNPKLSFTRLKSRFPEVIFDAEDLALLSKISSIGAAITSSQIASSHPDVYECENISDLIDTLQWDSIPTETAELSRVWDRYVIRAEAALERYVEVIQQLANLQKEYTYDLNYTPSRYADMISQTGRYIRKLEQLYHQHKYVRLQLELQDFNHDQQINNAKAMLKTLEQDKDRKREEDRARKRDNAPLR